MSYQTRDYTSKPSPPPLPPSGVGSTPGIDDFEYGTTVDSCSLAIRLGFIRKVYGILALQLILSLGTIVTFLYVDSVRLYVQTHPGLVWFAFFGTFGIVLFLVCIPSLTQVYPTNFILLFVFTIFEAYLLGVISSFYHTMVVMQAVIITACIAVLMTVYAMQTKRDLRPMGGFLFIGLIVLLMGGFLRLLFPSSPAVETVYAALGALLFSLYIMYDTFLIIHELTPDDYILAALKLYLDVINLFLFILQLFGRRD